MSENLLYYLDKYGVNQKLWNKIVKATAEWLESRKQWTIFREENTIRLLLTEKPFQKQLKTKKRRSSFEVFVNDVLEVTKETLLESGEVQPHAVIKIPKKKVVELLTLEGERSTWREQIIEAVDETDSKLYALITEGWVAPAHKKLSPAQHPFRKDIIFISVYSKRGERIMKVIYFTPLTSKEVTINKIETWRYFTDRIGGGIF